ncbi:MAG: hypothetical protein EPO16_10890 [Dehalococcoidia bacterium]|nr:MAG: hypothetical protein EPO16_10890 [Dehalococcoidia bacterium]
MHDTVYFEVQGRPSVFLASTEFVEAAEAQAAALGLPEVRRVFVPHPIQDAIDAEMQAKAEAAFDAVVGALLDA